MKNSGILHIGLVLTLVGLLSACGDDGCDDDVSWSATFISSGGSSSSTGGAIIQVNSNLQLAESSWLLDEPFPFDEPLPLPDLAATGDAMARTDWEVLDAVFSPQGTVALLDGGDGPVLWLLSDDPASMAVLPPEASRLLVTEDLPLRVLVIVGEDAAIPATRYTTEHAD